MEKLPPGRSFWEGGPSLDKYGTPLALMLIPYWTKGRITTMEGVYFEASGTTPYHFEAVAALVAPGENSNPVRGVPYRDQSELRHRRPVPPDAGVNYFLAHNPTTKQGRRRSPPHVDRDRRPTRTRTAPLGWNIYTVAERAARRGAHVRAGRRDERDARSRGWEQQDRGAVVVVPRTSSTSRWSRAARRRGSTPRARPRCDSRAGDHRPATRHEHPGHRRLDQLRRRSRGQAGAREDVVLPELDRERRRTDRTGPRPNFMVVVPTEKHVTLHYATTKA